MHWFNNLQSIPTIRQLREQTKTLTNRELSNAQKRLLAGDRPDLVLEQFAHALSQKFMHNPTEHLRRNHDEELLMTTRQLFDLDATLASSTDINNNERQNESNKD